MIGTAPALIGRGPFLRKDTVMAKKYEVHFSFYLSDSVEVEAESEQEAIVKVETMIAREEIGKIEDMEIGEAKTWID